MPASDELLTFNGVNARTGSYDLAPMTASAFVSIAGGVPPAADTQAAAELKAVADARQKSHFGAVEGVDYKRLDSTGWGVIFAENADPALREALSPLLHLRSQQAGALYREYIYKVAANGNPPETKINFLKRNQADAFGVVDPKRMPYYLLIVGQPDAIPFRFQYQLDVQYGVGRICFDTTAEYAAYARSVVQAESGALALPRRSAIFATRNPGDAATALSHDELALPLAAWADTRTGWNVQRNLAGGPQDASRASLEKLLNGNAPALLFTASHGLCYPAGDPQQLARQGALICQDWPGPTAGSIADEMFFAGDDLAPDAQLFGTIAMHFACFGGGTPAFSDYSVSGPPPALAAQSFLGRLPRRMLAHPAGGALAVIAHIERAWGCSFHENDAGKQIVTFTDALGRLMDEFPVGYAMETFNSRYAEIATELSSLQDDARDGVTVDPAELSHRWTATHDARGYSVIGDPAVRLRLAATDRPENRPILEVIPMSTVPPIPPIPAAAPAPVTIPQMTAADQAYFLNIGESIQGAAQSLQTAADKIGTWLANSFETVTSVQVSTYVSGTEDVTFENGVFTGAKLRAVTVANLDGNTRVCVPEQDGKVDDALWKIHSDTVDRAMSNRIEMLKTAAAAIASLVPGVKLP
jgi:hypothetical protein